MADAISNLGGGGLKTPYLANLANALDYAAVCITALLGGPLINKFGIKWSCVIAAVGFPLSPSGYYQNAKFGTEWYLLLAKVSFPCMPMSSGIDDYSRSSVVSQEISST